MPISQRRLLQLEQQFRAWVVERLELQRPVSHRFASKLVAELAERAKISQVQARQYLLNWGLNQILMADPTSPEFPYRESEMRATALFWWNQRDLF